MQYIPFQLYLVSSGVGGDFLTGWGTLKETAKLKAESVGPSDRSVGHEYYQLNSSQYIWDQSARK